MKNGFNILELFFGKKKTKQEVNSIIKENKKQDKKIIEKEQKDVYEDIFIGTIPFSFSNKQKKETNIHTEKKEKKQIENNQEVYEDIFIGTIPFSKFKDHKKQDDKEIFDDNKSQKQVDAKNDIIINIKNTILEQIEKNIKDDYHKINEIKYQLELLETQEQDELNKEEANELIEKLNNLIKDFEKIKKNFYSNHYDKLKSIGINDTYINSLIEEYKTAIRDNNVKDLGLLQIKEIEEYIEIINNISIIEQKQDKLSTNINDKKERLDITLQKMEEFENSYSSIEKVSKYIASFSKEQNDLIKNIQDKVNESSIITKTAELQTELYLDYSKILASTLLMAATTMIPPTKAGNILKLGLMTISIANFTNAIKTTTKEKKVTTKTNYIDYESTIKSGLGNINNLDTLISNSIQDIKYLKKHFIKEMEEYKYAIPEYTDLLVKLDSVEKELISKKDIAKEYEEKLQNTLKKNNAKVKRLEEEYFN